MSFLDKLKSLFSGGSSTGAHDHDHAGHDHDHAHEAAPLADSGYTSTPEPAAPDEAAEGEDELS